MTGWTAIVPIKPPGLAKSRLDVDSILRERLARSFAYDVLDAVAGAEVIKHIIVVTADTAVAAHARSTGALTIADRPMLSPAGLNDAVAMGRDWASRRWSTTPVVVVPADLPAMTSTTLGSALRRLETFDRSFVPDADGTGTTLSSAQDPSFLTPLFGPRSAGRHTDDGAEPVIEVDPRLRRDVDTVKDLAEARLLGVGRWTSDVLVREREHRSRHRRTRSMALPR